VKARQPASHIRAIVARPPASLIARLALCAVLLQPLIALGQYDAIGVYLTWQRDPATTMTINWVNLYAEGEAKTWYREKGTTAWASATGRQHVAGPSVLQVRHVELTGLRPDTTYELVVGAIPPRPPAPKVEPKKKEEDEEAKEAAAPRGAAAVRDIRSIYSFRTMPAELTRPVRFVAGGDMMHSREMVDAMNTRAGALDPDFALLGGDLAYANGSDAARWIDWFQSWTKNARGKGGRLIPMVVGIGNHEVRGGYNGQIPEDAPYYYGYFVPPGGRSHFALDFGSYLSLIVLDSAHTVPIAGAQASWLEAALGARAGQRHVFPVYHYPAYGTAKASLGKLPCESRRAVEIREHWIPHFERHGVTAVFENDHHNYKRTHPIRGHKRSDADGIVYLGDGAWGVNTRTVPKNAWYLAHAEPRRHLFHITLPPKGPVQVEAVDAKGKVFDKTSFIRPRTPPMP
jgi:acid phosphatase type 7